MKSTPLKKLRKLPLVELLQKRFPLRTREELIAMVYCREILVNGEVISNPRLAVPAESLIEVRVRKFVSRGGRKLDHALEVWSIKAEKKIVLDAGASTGGFTDCLLKRGASLVYAVDVGYNQIDYSLRRDRRVVVLERTNIMDVTLEKLGKTPDFAVADLSFRSIRGAANHILGLVGSGFMIALIKPQFEWESPPPYFRGIVEKDKDLYGILERLVMDLLSSGVLVNRVLESPIRGQKGNREFFFELMDANSLGEKKKRGIIDKTLKVLKDLVFK